MQWAFEVIVLNLILGVAIRLRWAFNPRKQWAGWGYRSKWGAVYLALVLLEIAVPLALGIESRLQPPATGVVHVEFTPAPRAPR